MIRLVHLSDLHVSHGNLGRFQSVLLPALIKDLKTFNKDAQINLIVISGDLVDRGGCDWDHGIGEGFQTFETAVLLQLRDSLSLKKKHVFFVPGNHDMDRTVDTLITENGLKGTLISKDSIYKYFAALKVNSDGIKRMNKYMDFMRNYYEGQIAYENVFHVSHKTSIDSVSIGITCVNSAWRSYDSSTDPGQLLVGQPELEKHISAISDCDLKIIVMHHPMEHISQIERSEIVELIHNKYEILLCGHCHTTNSQSITTANNCIYESMAPANWSYNFDQEVLHLNGYSIIDINPATHTLVVHNRCFSSKRQEYVSDTQIGDTLTFQYSRKAPSLEFKCLENITAQLPGLDENLISYGTDTHAPKTIKDIFVLPKLTYDRKYTEKKLEEKELALDEICQYNQNLIFFGIKESGKTVLLDRICLQLVEEHAKYKKIPVITNFSDFNKTDYEAIICSVLSLSRKQVVELLNNSHVVLLVDNLRFDENASEKLGKLQEFLSKYPKVTLIGTSLTITENEFPTSFLTNNKINVKPVSIAPFRTHQIKRLIEIWFSGLSAEWKKESLSKIINALKELNVPNTPLSLSMFLWIIEKNGVFRPINQATMLENFIEKMLEKHARREALSESFDYRNKERLLADIAFKMHGLDTDNYRIPYADILEFIDSHLQARCFHFSSQGILTQLLDSGILLREKASNSSSSTVRFRFACFFEYFLMKKMDFNDKFRSDVLGDLLPYTNEIVYFTGIKRDRKDILDLVVSQLWAITNPLLNIINQMPNTFDDYFFVPCSVASSINEEFFNQTINAKRPTENDIEKNQDKLLASIEVKSDIAHKGRPQDSIDTIEKLLSLAAKVFKNSEEINDPLLKEEYYNKILLSSMVFSVLLRIALRKDIIDKQKEQKHIEEITYAIYMLLPLLHETLLHGLMGTAKLVNVFEKKISADSNRLSISEYERFMSLFLYADSHGENASKHLKDFVDKTRCSYMHDMVLFKLLGYFFFESKTDTTDRLYQNLMADIIIHAKKLSPKDKSKIIAGYQRQKLIGKFKNHDGNA